MPTRAYIRTRTHTRSHVRTHAHVYACTHARTHTRTHARTHTMAIRGRMSCQKVESQYSNALLLRSPDIFVYHDMSFADSMN